MSVSVPPDTDSWQEAVTEGYYGKRTDPFPDELYDAVRIGVPPTVTSMSPTNGPDAGGTQVTISGTKLYRPVVTFGGQTATIDSLSGDGTSVVCTTPPHGTGVVDVTITTPGGSHTESGIYMYEPPPEPVAEITAAAPGSLPSDAPSTEVTVTGSLLTTAYEVKVQIQGGAAVTGPATVVNDTTITTLLQGPGLGNGGAGDLSVMMFSGDYTNTIPFDFT